MASRESKHQKQRNNQIRGILSKLRPHLKEDHATDPSWSFLEDIDAPQWVDLSLEVRSKGNDGFDSWFADRHEYHVISLAGMNSGTSWSSVTSSLQDYSAKPSSSVNAWRGSLKKFEDSYCTPKCGVDSGQRSRSSSSASNFFLMPKSGHSSDASMKTANAKYDTSRKSFDQGYHAPAVSKKVVHGQAASFEDGVSHFIKTSLFAQQMKRAGAKQLPVTGRMHDKTRECEKNLAALVAQHNQKIRKHGLQGCRKVDYCHLLY